MVGEGGQGAFAAVGEGGELGGAAVDDGGQVGGRARARGLGWRWRGGGPGGAAVVARMTSRASQAGMRPGRAGSPPRIW